MVQKVKVTPELIKTLQKARAGALAEHVNLSNCRSCDPKLAQDAAANVVNLEALIADLEKKL